MNFVSPSDGWFCADVTGGWIRDHEVTLIPFQKWTVWKISPSSAPRYQKQHRFVWRFPGYTLLFFHRTMLRWIWLWSIGGMILTGKSRSTGTETCNSATLSTTNPKRTGRQRSRSAADDQPPELWLRAFRNELHVNDKIRNFSPCLTEGTLFIYFYLFTTQFLVEPVHKLRWTLAW